MSNLVKGLGWAAAGALAMAACAAAYDHALRTDTPLVAAPIAAVAPQPVGLPPGYTLDMPPDPESKVIYTDGRVTTLREAQMEARRHLPIEQAMPPSNEQAVAIDEVQRQGEETRLQMLLQADELQHQMRRAADEAETRRQSEASRDH